jgi:uncharacterized protein
MSPPEPPEMPVMSGAPPETSPTGDLAMEAPAPPPEPAPETSPEPGPFWGYPDLFLFAGLSVPSLLLGILMVKTVLSLLRLHPPERVFEVLPEQLAGYLILFGVLLILFRVQYDQPFWSSLGWVDRPLRTVRVVLAGTGTAWVVALAGALIRIPNESNPMTELMQGRTALVLMAVFGVLIAPVFEELAFRGFLQPLLVRSFGAVAGVVVAGLAFGLLHYQEYKSWRHVLLIAIAGMAFGWMRHVTRSTKASIIMHASYNALLFALLLLSASQRKGLPHSW